MSHSTLFVLDQDSAKDFYVNKLGFEVKMDHDMGNWRWLTVCPKGQPDLQIVLMKIMAYGAFDEQAAAMMKELMAKGVMGAGIFQTDNCQKTYEEMLAKGVVFKQPPHEMFYGIEAIFSDDSGNWFSLTQPKAGY
jgi:predicted enzyme related to lactoylglutathione lyase